MTAIEWLVNEANLLENNGWILPLIEKAKEMEKQNLYNFYIQGGIDCVSEADRTVENYYNEQFKTK